MISLVRNLKCISQQNIHHYLNRRYKFYITSLKAVIASKSLISVALDIDRILHFVSHNKILQIYRQHWIRKFYRHILSKYRQISKKCVCVCVCVGGGGLCYTTHSPDWQALAYTSSSSIWLVSDEYKWFQVVSGAYGWFAISAVTNKINF